MSLAVVVLLVLLVAAGALLLCHLRTRRAPTPAPSIGKLKTLGDPWSSLGPNTKVWAAVTPAGVTIPAYYKRQLIRLSIDTASATAVVYGWLGTGGPPTASSFHFALSPSQPPLELEYTGLIQLVSSSGTIFVGAIEG